jgi:histidinol-phosphate aminotransferase
MIESLIRSHIKQFTPYRSARSEAMSGRIFLDANELSCGSPVMFNGVSLNRYPDPLQLQLRDVLARRHRVNRENLFVGVGSDEVIDLLIRLTCEPTTESVAILEPTYGVYRVAADLNAVYAQSIDLDSSFQIDMQRTIHSLPPSTKILFCCSPNNPTGNLLRREDILRLCHTHSGLVVVDEAYVDFATTNENMIESISTIENLVVLRTLSKSWGLAGIRLGYCIAHPTMISYLLRIKAPYSINAVSSKLALDALRNEKFFHNAIEGIKNERERLREHLQHCLSVKHIYPSDANFLLVECDDAARIFSVLSERGIIVRRRSEPRLQNCLRITVGTPEENTLLLETLKEVR